MRWLSRLALSLWLALLVLVSLLPRLPRAGGFTWFPGDAYVGHGVAYAVLCVLAAWALKCRRRRALALTAVAAVVLGVLLECIQPLTGRTFDVLDMGANAAGAAVGLAAMLVVCGVTDRREAVRD